MTSGHFDALAASGVYAQLEFHVNQHGSSIIIGPLVRDWQHLLSQSVEEGQWRHACAPNDC